jgi:hypothetical protein
MRTVLLLALCVPLATAAPAPDGKADSAAKKELFAKEDWYKDQKGDETAFVGELQKKKGGGGIGIVQRFNPYQLISSETVKIIVEKNVNGVVTKEVVPEVRMIARDVYVGGSKDILDEFVGKNVKITGKAVSMELEGTKFNEIWPAAIELVKEDKKPEEKKLNPKNDEKKEERKGGNKVEGASEVKILAHSPWKPALKGGDPPQNVFRSAEELAKASGLEKPEGEEAQKKATEAAAKALKVDDIDWKKQMVIVVTGGMKRTGGYSIEITKIETADKTMTVHWKLISPGARSAVTQTITHPALTVIVDRFEGTVVFDPPAAKDGQKDK